jgi:hypothetical protein
MNITSDETVYALSTPVRTSHREGTSIQEGYLVFKNGKRGKYDPAGVCFRTNGGTWSLATLLGLDGYAARKGERCERLSIDFGQNWTIENMGAVIDEILAHSTTRAVESMCKGLAFRAPAKRNAAKWSIEAMLDELSAAGEIELRFGSDHRHGPAGTYWFLSVFNRAAGRTTVYRGSLAGVVGRAYCNKPSDQEIGS